MALTQRLLIIALGFALPLLTLAAQSPSPKRTAAVWKFGADRRLVWHDELVSHLGGRGETPAWAPKVNPERPRGGIEVYAKVAPAVVVVRTDAGHGTGFFVSQEGHVLTNHHVIAQGLRHDSKRGASYAQVHLGSLAADGSMTLRKESVTGSVLKLDPAVDLAMLKIDSLPTGYAPAFLSFAPAPPKPGSTATIIGHPASGLLWTMRTGQLASIGSMPADLVDFVMNQLSATAAQRQQLASQLSAIPSRRIVLTSAGANPGDSGGPVVDEAGRVIAVTFAIPADPARAKFSYHIHLDEVRRFMANPPARPMIVTPDPWDFGPMVELQDMDGDRIPDVLVAGADGPEVFLFDLDNDTPREMLRDVGGLVRRRQWNFEVGLRLVPTEPTSAAFYDTDNSEDVDVIHVVQDEDHKRNTTFIRTTTGWRVDENVALTFPSHTYVKDPKLAQRLRVLLGKFAP